MNQLFNVIGTLLSHPDQTARHFWKTCKFHDTIETCFVSIWLVRRKDEEASCFQMIMVPLAECDGVWSKFCTSLLWPVCCVWCCRCFSFIMECLCYIRKEAEVTNVCRLFVTATTGPVHQNGRPVTSTDKADVEQVTDDFITWHHIVPLPHVLQFSYFLLLSLP